MIPGIASISSNQSDHDETPRNNPSANASYAQLTFKPASGNVTDLLDLNELFADEFYPPDLDFSRFLQQDEEVQPSQSQSAINREILHTSSSTSISQPFMLSSSCLQSSFVNRENTDTILIPPIIPATRLITSQTITNHEPEDSWLDNTLRIEKQSGVKRDLSADVRNQRFPNKAQKISDLKELSDNQRVERRERNREHAKRSRIRKKLLLDSLQDQLLALRQENISLRRVVVEKIPSKAAKILSECTTVESSLLASMNELEDQRPSRSELLKPSPLTTNIAQNLISAVTTQTTLSKSLPRQQAKILMEPDYRLIQSLVTSQQNFVLSDPSLPDNPIVYASEGFCKLTGYKRHEVLGRNCRFLQGPLTDQQAVEIIRQGISEGRDISVCLLNYKADGKPFWNQFFLAALKDSEGQIVNYVGVQCEVNNIPVFEIKDRVKKLPIPSDM